MQPPQGELRSVWRIDTARYEDDPDYRAAVEAFIDSRIVGGSHSDAEVLADDAGQRVLTSLSHFDRDGDWLRDPAGHPNSARVMVALDPKEPLP